MCTQRALQLTIAVLLGCSALPPSARGADEYIYDDGSSEGALGLTGGGVLAWAQHFTVTPGNEALVAVSAAFGARIGGHVPQNAPFGAGVWSDPDGDGHPGDGELMAHGNGTTTVTNEDVFLEVSFPPVTIPGGVGASFFLVVWIEHATNEYPAAMDQSSGPSNGRAWATGEAEGTYDPNGFNPEIGWHEMDSIKPGVWLLRGTAYHDPIPGDIDGDGDVDLADLAILLAAYDTCEGDPNYNPAADIDGSGCVDLADLGILLAHYGEGT